MTTFTTPHWLAQARELSFRTGVPERRVLEIMAGKIGAALAIATADQRRFHLSRDLKMIERRLAEIGSYHTR